MSEDLRNDVLLRHVGELNAPALPPALEARVRARARDAFVRGERPPTALARLGRLAAGAAVCSAIVVYLTWAALFVSALARG
jgi:hypothetical protein